MLVNSNATTGTTPDRFPRLATDGAGNWVAVWESEEEPGEYGFDNDIFGARSTDNGASWSTAIPLNTSASTDSAEDYNPAIAANGTGNWVAVWYGGEDVSGAGTDDDIFLTRFTLSTGGTGCGGLKDGPNGDALVFGMLALGVALIGRKAALR